MKQLIKSRGGIEMDLMQEAYNLCEKIIAQKPKNFTGIGLVIYDENEFDESLHCDLRPNIKCQHYFLNDERLVDYLIDVSNHDNTLHDGFHLMNSEGILTHVAQYFVPPIISDLVPNQDHGVRLHSSLCGSTMKGILFITVICTNMNIYILKDGRICRFEENAYV